MEADRLAEWALEVWELESLQSRNERVTLIIYFKFPDKKMA